MKLLKNNFPFIFRNLKFLTRLKPSTPVAEIRYLLERGSTFNLGDEKEKAVVLFKEAYDNAVEIKEGFYAIDAAHVWKLCCH
jgi:hypothetical protein